MEFADQANPTVFIAERLDRADQGLIDLAMFR
jgi:hypothetical protein